MFLRAIIVYKKVNPKNFSKQSKDHRRCRASTFKTKPIIEYLGGKWLQSQEDAIGSKFEIATTRRQ